MKLWHYGLFLLLTIIIFGQYIFNPIIIGADTWHYVNIICGKEPAQSIDPIFDFIINFFPCSFPVIKIWLASLFFITLIFAAKIGELYEKENGWIMGIVVAALTMFPLEYLVFENDSLAYTLFFIALYLVLKSKKAGKGIFSIENLAALGIMLTSGFIWKGVVYWFVPLAILAPIFIVPFLGLLILYFDTFFWFLETNRTIMENVMFLGIIYLGLTVFFSFGLLKMSKKEALVCCLMIIPCIFVQKLYVLAIPFVAIMTICAIFSIKKHQPLIISTLITFSIIMAAFWGIHTYNDFPTNDDFVIVQYAAELTSTVENDFGIGYIAKYNDLNVSSFGITDGNDYICKGYVLEHPQISDCNMCKKIKSSQNIVLWHC